MSPVSPHTLDGSNSSIKRRLKKITKSNHSTNLSAGSERVITVIRMVI